ncbi:transcriptional regulator GutM [Radiobacillus kanasensis]|uniref:transcriptional regulator GutM n=1 Tax=Radiobacillus kanasensis TaxID=2844358 RepID=UPI001E3FA2E0|nr:transcriptional regulator GutM [Radiobacillus kanasensis]UFT98604.1 transcriptional regulator GutM [Radiobacillus kanasensis]
MWGVLIAAFVVVWFLQIFLTSIQMKHYRRTLQLMSRRSNGYLGVGVDKQKFGVGTVVIVVCDNVGKVVDSKLMKGVTVFSRFKPFQEVIGDSIETLKDNQATFKMEAPVSMAVKNIKDQMDKKQLA